MLSFLFSAVKAIGKLFVDAVVGMVFDAVIFGV
jgi:hypothetical protein